MIETITAIATPAGKGGVGIIRISGPETKNIARKLLGFIPKPRYATLCAFQANNEILDEGIALYFPAPHSFTGEEVLELQGHGGPVVLNRVLQYILQSGARLAQPGEFSLRAFLNNKMDLTQAEAVSDLINADSEQAAQSAMRSLTGEFSKKIVNLQEKLIHLRTLVEAAIDFPEEEIDFIAEHDVKHKVEEIQQELQAVLTTAKQGALLREGMTVVIAGKPNAGKSSLLNCLAGAERAIVTEIPGTTRDVLREQINLDGLPLHIIDTAGLRETTDIVEQEGVRRAQLAMETADLILLMVDARQTNDVIAKARESLPQNLLIPRVVVANKIDLLGDTPAIEQIDGMTCIKLSVKKNLGITLLRDFLKEFMGYNQRQEGVFIARQRHLDALNKAAHYLQHGYSALQQQQAAELLAEDLRSAHVALAEITGEFSADDLLGEIFSSFCIGK